MAKNNMFTLIGATAHGTEDREQNDFYANRTKSNGTTS